MMAKISLAFNKTNIVYQESDMQTELLPIHVYRHPIYNYKIAKVLHQYLNQILIGFMIQSNFNCGCLAILSSSSSNLNGINLILANCNESLKSQLWLISPDGFFVFVLNNAVDTVNNDHSVPHQNITTTTATTNIIMYSQHIELWIPMLTLI